MIKNGLIVVAGVGTALASLTGLDNSYYAKSPTKVNAQRHVEMNGASTGSKAYSYSGRENNYIYVQTTVFDLAKDILGVSRDFSVEESEGYGKFVEQFFS
ncbi:MAG: hypothetical protein RRB22_03575 [Gammaproteobacteria bacterium]|nr:hypothetical protein [Gammaproteobacteria bacterium]